MQESLLKKQKKIILITFFSTLSIFIGYLAIHKKTYTTNFSISSNMLEGTNKYFSEANTLKKNEIEQLITNFNSIYNFKQKYRSDSIKKDEYLAANTKSFQLYTNRPDEINYKIRIETFSPNIIPLIAKRFIEYVNESAYIKDKVNLEIKRKKELIEMYDKQIDEMRVRSKTSGDRNANISIVSYNLDMDITSLSEKKSELNNTLHHDHKLSISIAPIIPIKPDGLDAFEICIIGIICSIASSLFIGYILQTRSNK